MLSIRATIFILIYMQDNLQCAYLHYSNSYVPTLNLKARGRRLHKLGLVVFESIDHIHEYNAIEKIVVVYIFPLNNSNSVQQQKMPTWQRPPSNTYKEEKGQRIPFSQLQIYWIK